MYPNSQTKPRNQIGAYDFAKTSVPLNVQPDVVCVCVRSSSGSGKFSTLYLSGETSLSSLIFNLTHTHTHTHFHSTSHLDFRTCFSACTLFLPLSNDVSRRTTSPFWPSSVKAFCLCTGASERETHRHITLFRIYECMRLSSFHFSGFITITPYGWKFAF